MSDAIEGERGVSEVAGKRSAWLTPTRKAGGIALITLLAVAFIFWKNPGHRPEEEAKPPPSGIGQDVHYDPPKPPPMPQPAATAPPAPAPAQVQPQPQPQLQPQPQPLPHPQSFFPQVQGPAKEPPHHPHMLSFATDDSGASANHGAGGAAPSAPETHVTFKSGDIVGAAAGKALDQDLTLMPGVIACVLDSAVDSTVAGPLICHLNNPVLSATGVTLLPKDTRIIGQYSSELRQGQGRLQAATATAYTPDGVPVPLGGTFSDALGRAGLDGVVDNHLMERFGGAVLLQLADSGFSLAQAALSKGGNSYISLGSGGVSSLSDEVLRNTINIKPTIQKYQGDVVGLWILTPIDFHAAYKLKAVP